MGASSQLREELLCFFAEPVPPRATKRNAKAWAKVQIELGQLKSAAPFALVVGSPANTSQAAPPITLKESWETHLGPVLHTPQAEPFAHRRQISRPNLLHWSKFTRSFTKTTARSTLELPGERSQSFLKDGR